MHLYHITSVPSYYYILLCIRNRISRTKVKVGTPWQRMFNRLYLSPGKAGANAACNYWPNLGSVHQGAITVDRGNVGYEVCPTLLHIASNGNRTLDLLILSPTPHPLGHNVRCLSNISSYLTYKQVKDSAVYIASCTCSNYLFSSVPLSAPVTQPRSYCCCCLLLLSRHCAGDAGSTSKIKL